METASTELVVALCALGLGDVVVTIPALRLLRQACPDADVALLAPRAFGALAVMSGAVDRLIDVCEADVLNALRPSGVIDVRNPDVAVNLHGDGPQSRSFLTALNPRTLVTLPLGALTQGTVPSGQHRRETWADLVRAAYPCVADVPTPSVYIAGKPLPPAGVSVIHPGAASTSRRWPVDRFAEVARRLGECGHRVVVSRGPGESALGYELSRLAGVPLLPVLSLRVLHGVLAGARLLVCGDTGVAHVGYTAGVPSVVLFGPVHPSIWGPPAHPRHQVLFHGDGRGDPHADTVDESLLAITVAEVMAAVDCADRYADASRRAVRKSSTSSAILAARSVERRIAEG